MSVSHSVAKNSTGRLDSIMAGSVLAVVLVLSGVWSTSAPESVHTIPAPHMVAVTDTIGHMVTIEGSAGATL